MRLPVVLDPHIRAYVRVVLQQHVKLGDVLGRLGDHQLGPLVSAHSASAVPSHRLDVQFVKRISLFVVNVVLAVLLASARGSEG